MSREETPQREVVVDACGCEIPPPATGGGDVEEPVTRLWDVREVQLGLLSGALEFSSKRTADVMVPLHQLVTLPEDASAADVEKAVARTGFSRFALTEDDGELNGYLHIKDVLSIPESRYNEPVPVTRVRSLANLRPGIEIDDALAAMQRTGSHLARVVDAGGQTLGVLFLEDVIEELVGEIRDTTQDRRQRRGDRVDTSEPPR